MGVVYINRIPSTPTSLNVAPTEATLGGAYTPGEYLNMTVRLVPGVGVATVLPVGAMPLGQPQLFYGFLVGDNPRIVIASGRGSVVTPRVEGGGVLVPGTDVYLSVTPGYVTQTTSSTDGRVQLRLGFALNTTTMVLATDFRLEF